MDFELQEERSTATLEEVRGIFDDRPDGFVGHNLPKLKDLEMNSRIQEWFRRLIERCRKETHKEALRKLLGQAGGVEGGD